MALRPSQVEREEGAEEFCHNRESPILYQALQAVLLVHNHTEVREGGCLESIKLRSTNDRYLTYILGEAWESGSRGVNRDIYQTKATNTGGNGARTPI